LRQRIIDEVLASELRDNVDARELQPDGSYTAPVRAAGEESFSAQKYFMAAANVRSAAANEAAFAAAPATNPVPAGDAVPPHG
jgi:polyphosphate kinase